MSFDIDIYNDDPDTKFASNNKISIVNWLYNESSNYFYTFGLDWKSYAMNGISLQGRVVLPDLELGTLEILLTQELAKNRFNCEVNLELSPNGRELNTTIIDRS